MVSDSVAAAIASIVLHKIPISDKNEFDASEWNEKRKEEEIIKEKNIVKRNLRLISASYFNSRKKKHWLPRKKIEKMYKEIIVEGHKIN